MADATLAFDILARDRASDAFGSAGRSADGLGGKLKSLGGIAAKAIGGAAIGAVVGLGAAMAQGVKDAVSYQTLQLKTEAVLKSTGNVAGTSVKGVQSLASQLESLSGVDEELIINSENVLATFTNIRNVGKDKMFDAATKSALDMSVALGTDLQGASIQIGKALNDPVKGITALSKVGVSFTDAQRDQIKAMVAAGDTMGAQKLILKELNTEFGGAAKAAGSGFAGDLARLKDAFSDAFREVGTKILPYLADMAAWLSERLPGAIDSVSVFLGQFAAVMRENVLPVVEDIVAFLRDNWQPVLIGVGAVILGLLSPFLLVAAGLAALYLKFEWFRDAVSAIVQAVTQFWEDHQVKIQEVFTNIVDLATSFYEAFKAVFDRVVAVITDIWERFGHTLLEKLSTAFDAIAQMLGGVITTLSGIFDLIKAVMTGKWGAAWDAIVKILSGVWETIKGTLKLGLDAISLAFEAAKAGLSAAWAAVWHGFATVVSDVFDLIKDTVRNAVKFVGRQIDDMLGPVDELIGKLAKVGGGVVGKVGGAIGHIPGFASGVTDFSGGLAYVHKGEVLANLAPGTNVIPAKQVQEMAGSGTPDPITWGRQAAQAYAAELRLQMRIA